jgi:hypothetical protein
MLRGQSLLETDAFQRLARIIQDGNCVLFLGAGVSLDSGAPSGRELAEELSARFFPMESVSTDFGAVCEAVDANFSRKTLNEFMIERFRGPVPRGALLSIPRYHWKSIYTMNFDTLLEDAYRQATEAAQKVHPFFSDKDAVSLLAPGEIALYKLHGCLSRPNSREGRLTLTSDDIALVGESRQRLLNRLLDDASDYTIFYVGFARADRDFRGVLLDVARAAGNLTELRRSYALQPNYQASQVAVWDAKGNAYQCDGGRILRDARHCRRSGSAPEFGRGVVWRARFVAPETRREDFSGHSTRRRAQLRGHR